MSKNRKKKANLKSSILILLLMAILLTASTYAWFTANKTVRVSTLNVNVQAQNGLQISADGEKWKSVLDLADITPDTIVNTYPTSANQIPTVLESVSTAGLIDTAGAKGMMNMYYGKIEADDALGKLTATKEPAETNGTEGKYIAFDMFLRVYKETAITLTENSGVTYVGDNDKGLQNASRVAFCFQGTKPVGTPASELQGLYGATDFGEEGSTTYIWEPNSDAHTAAGAANADQTYGIETSAGTGQAPVPYYGIKDAITEGIPLDQTNSGSPNESFFVAVDPTWKTNATMTDTTVFTLKAGITKVRVYMWIEGQDVDCENDASGSDIKFDMEFTAQDA